MTVSDHCSSKVCTATFTVAAYPDDIVQPVCPNDPNLAGCATTADIAGAWSTWTTALGNITPQGSCNPTISYSPPLANLVAPTECGISEQKRTVIVTVSDDCSSKVCTATFTVAAYPDDIVQPVCPNDPNLAGCATTADIRSMEYLDNCLG